MPHSIPFFLVTGFLGSGKTTLLKNILVGHADSRRLAVIQNEFAPGNVDGAELRGTGKNFEILEINRGSVFCVCLLSDFTRSLLDLVDSVHPDAVVLEATGLADPIAVAQLLHAPTLRERLYLSHVWCIVDASTFMKLHTANTRVVHQVRVADTIVLNKTDRLAGSEGAIRERLSALNPFAEVVATTYCDFDLSKIFAPRADSPVADRREHEHTAFTSSPRPDIVSAVIRSTRAVSRDALARFLDRNGRETYRLKGYVVLDDGAVVGVQSCFGETTTRDIDHYSGPSELIALGPGLDPASLQKDFDDLS